MFRQLLGPIRRKPRLPEVASMENEKTVFANQNTLYAFIILFNFLFLDKTCKRNKRLEFPNEKASCKLAGS